MLKQIPLIPITELFAKGLSFMIIIVLTRLLSVEEYGLFNYIISFVMLVSVLMDGGINNFIFNKSVKNELDEINIYFNSRIVLSFFIISLLSIIVYFYQKEYFLYISIYALFVFFNSTLSFFKMLARGQEYRKIDIQTILLDPLFRLFLLIIVFISHIEISLYEILEIFLIVEFLIFIWLYFYIKKYFNISLSFHNLFSKLKSILLDSKYFLFYYIFFVGLQRLDVLFIAQTINNEAVALFSSAYNLYMVILLFFSSYLTSGFKAILKNRENLISYIKNIILFYILITCTIFLLSDWIYSVLYPLSYREAHNYLIWLMFSLPFTIISYFGIYYFNYIKKTHYNVLLLLLFFILKFIYLFFMEFKTPTEYVYSLIGIEIIVGIAYFVFLLKTMKGTYYEDTSNK